VQGEDYAGEDGDSFFSAKQENPVDVSITAPISKIGWELNMF